MAEVQVTINNEPAVVTKLQKTQTQGDTNTVYFAPFGADDENIQMYEEHKVEELTEYTKWGSLRNFFQEWLNFKKIWGKFIDEAQFIQYGSTEPDSENVKIWFQIQDNESSGE